MTMTHEELERLSSDRRMEQIHRQRRIERYAIKLACALIQGSRAYPEDIGEWAVRQAERIVEEAAK